MKTAALPEPTNSILKPNNTEVEQQGTAPGSIEEADKQANVADAIGSQAPSPPTSSRTGPNSPLKIPSPPTDFACIVVQQQPDTVAVPNASSDLLDLNALEAIDESTLHNGPADLSNRHISTEARCNANHFLQAQLAPPTVQAVSVMIDEDVYVGNAFRPQNLNDDCSPLQNQSRLAPRRYIAAISIVVAVVLSIIITTQVIQKNGDTTTTSQPPLDGAPTESPSYNYSCFSSTKDLLEAQIQDYRAANSTADVYIICPNTTITIGVLENPAAGENDFVNGDYPLWVLDSDTTIQCGLDGRVENNCVLDGGFVQFLVQTAIPVSGTNANQFLEFVEADIVLDNVTVRGITFTGMIGAVGPYDGGSVMVSQSGHITFVDCWWTDLVASAGLIWVYQNTFQHIFGFTLLEQSVWVTIRNCRFENIILDLPLFFSQDQILEVDDCIFSNVTVSQLAVPKCSVPDLNGTLVDLEGGCANLMICLTNSKCSFKRSCVNNMEITGPGLIYLSFAENLVDLHVDNASLATAFSGASDNFLDVVSREELPCEVVVGNGGHNATTCWDSVAFNAVECMSIT